jgi:sulfofructose kinase
VFTVEAWPSVSAKIPASRYDESGGGMAANAAVAIARLGGDAVLWSPLGEDGIADIIRAQLLDEGVDVEALRRFPGRTSSTSAVIVDRRGERLVIGYRGTALQAPSEWLPLGQVRSAGALLADVRWQEGAATALRAARDAGVPAILDAEEATAEILEALVGCADHAVFSERGLAVFAPGDAEGGLRRARALGVQVAAVTQGAAGVMWVEAGAAARVRREPGFASEQSIPWRLVTCSRAYALAIASGSPVRDAMRSAAPPRRSSARGPADVLARRAATRWRRCWYALDYPETH